MDTPQSPPAVPRIPLETLTKVFATADRIRILRELAKGEALMTKELAARSRRSESMTSKHLRVLREAGIIRRGRGNLHSLLPAHTVPGRPDLVDLGSCLFRFGE
jgi:predicted transcriptional regulator